MRTYASWFSQVQAPERAGPSPNAYVSKRQHSSEQRRIRQHTSAFSPTPSPSPNSGAHHGGAGQEKSERQALQVLSLLALPAKKKVQILQKKKYKYTGEERETGAAGTQFTSFTSKKSVYLLY
jgi:hypothetical protein